MLNRVGVIGDKDSVLALKAIGIEVFDVNDAVEAREVLKKMQKEDFAVILITEEFAIKNSDIIKKSKTKTYPAIVPIPTSKGSTGFGLSGVKKDVEKAIGMDILFNREDK